MAKIAIPGYILLDLQILSRQVLDWRRATANSRFFKEEKPQVSFNNWINKYVKPYVQLSSNDKATVSSTFVSAAEWDKAFTKIRSELIVLLSPAAIAALDAWRVNALRTDRGRRN